MPPELPPDPQVDAVIRGLPKELTGIAKQLRSLVRKTAPELRECVKWGNPMWVGNTYVTCIMIFPNHLNLGFFNGATMSRRFKELEGTGKGLRHVKIRSLADAKAPVLSRILREAVRLDQRKAH